MLPNPLSHENIPQNFSFILMGGLGNVGHGKKAEPKDPPIWEQPVGNIYPTVDDPAENQNVDVGALYRKDGTPFPVGHGKILHTCVHVWVRTSWHRSP